MARHQITISAEIRDDVGKGASRRLRRIGRIPGVIYGGHKDAVSLTLEHREIQNAAEHESFYSSIMEIRVGDGRTQKVIVRDMQRHPFRRQIMHLDFQRVSETEVLRMSLPLHFIGEAASPAAKASGVVIQHLITEVEVAALPKDLPEYLEVDLSALDAGDAVRLSDIRLPEGVRIVGLTTDEETNDMVANAIHVAEEVEEVEEVEGEEVEGEAGEEEGEEGKDESAEESGEESDKD